MRPTPPRRAWGIAVAVFMIVVETLLVYPLLAVATPAAVDVVYLLGVLLVSTLWGLWLGVATAVASALAYVFFHVAPAGRISVTDARDWVQLAVFLVVAVLTSALADLSRLRAVEAQESDLTAELARLLLNVDDVAAALPAVAQRIAHALDLPAAAVEIETFLDQICDETDQGERPADSASDDVRRSTFALRDGHAALGTLRVRAGMSDRQVQRLQQRVTPSLASLLLAARERGAMRTALEVRGEAFHQLARQQAALRRVATLVARGARPAEVFDAVMAEVSRLLGNRHTTLLRYEPDDTVTIVSTNQPGLSTLVGGRLTEDSTIASLVRRTGSTARIDDYADFHGPGAARGRALGIHAAVGVPVLVEDRLWGAAAVTSMRPEPLPSDAEASIKDFTDLAATAIANADNRAQLIASRARIATAADEERQRIERELHAGAQQQLVAIYLELGALGTTEDADAIPEPVRVQLARSTTELKAVVQHLREFAQGIHPAVLTTGGLKPALKTLARRSAIPVDLDIHLDHPLPAGVEMAAYYIVSESLTNAAQHAHVSIVHVEVRTQRSTLQLAIRDNGVGGADPVRGTGLTGLKDRVETLGGHMTITSPPGAGTSLRATIPIGPS
ncbi:DUF4118 domain-containing protein [Dactylosporangium sp. AC04546]|uniref:sensor histidine kinase n=1 Tax=Dactylosporangium sp. AC04546 TaxID=2862460 RepID=UPI001EDE417C|nr:DUF4118 domain-containing protein [Dactylosporangium sp. AC04546]WVK89736.1 DUF4118 domain-containing protein [Dactylosporangium sp. AC04546]